MKYLRMLAIPSGSIVFIPFIYSILNEFKISIHPAVYLISIIVIMLLTGYITGITLKEKGFVNGLLIGSIVSIILFIFSLIIRCSLSWYSLLYYLIIIISTMLGSVIGVNKKHI